MSGSPNIRPQGSNNKPSGILHLRIKTRQFLSGTAEDDKMFYEDVRQTALYDAKTTKASTASKKASNNLN